MPSRHSQQSSAARLRHWADHIPLGSLEQLQQANPGAQHDLPPAIAHEDAENTRLPASEVSSVAQPLLASVGGLSAQLRDAGTDVASAIPLPVSVAQSCGTAGRSSSTINASANSLAQLQNAGPRTQNEVALPSSTSMSYESSHDSSAESRRDGSPSQRSEILILRDEKTYWQSIAPLTAFLPHLEKILPPRGRHDDVGQVTCIDYLNDGTRRVGEPLIVKQVASYGRLHQLLGEMGRTISAEVTSRTILVEDLCPRLIEALGSVFRIDPEFFAEHLNRSGYDGVDYGDIDPSRWKSSHLTKQYISMTWFRPVRQDRRVTEWLKAPSSLLAKREVKDRPGARTEPSTISWSDPAYTIDGHRLLSAMKHKARVDNNVFRRSWSLSAKSLAQYFPIEAVKRPTRAFLARDGQIEVTVSNETSENPIAMSDSVPTAWEERASFFPYTSHGARIGILLVDPLPSITDVQTPLQRLRSNEGRRNTAQQQEPQRHQMTVALPMTPRLPVQMPTNKYEAAEEATEALKSSFGTLQSACEVILSDERHCPSETADQLRADPIVALLRVVEMDTLAFFRSLEWTLVDIGHDSLDDYLMTRMLSEWRQLMSDFENHVPAIGKQLEAFVEFVFLRKDDRSLPAEVQAIVVRIHNEISRIKVRLDEAYAGLRADMQFTESRRSITEAKTVTRLTELAFIFIPLSFCASLFSMSVQELQDGVPIWTFIVTALVTVTCAYAARIFIGSELLVNSTRRSFEKLWATSHVRPGDNPPALTIVWFTTLELWRRGASKLGYKAFGTLSLTLLTLIAVGTLWSFSGMDGGFDTAITLVIMLPVLGFGLIRLFSEASSRTWFPWGRRYVDSEGEDV